MANTLSTEKQVAVIGALAEGSSIRSIERMTGIHRDTIMRLGVRGKINNRYVARLDELQNREWPLQIAVFLSSERRLWGLSID